MRVRSWGDGVSAKVKTTISITAAAKFTQAPREKARNRQAVTMSNPAVRPPYGTFSAARDKPLQSRRKPR